MCVSQACESESGRPCVCERPEICVAICVWVCSWAWVGMSVSVCVCTHMWRGCLHVRGVCERVYMHVCMCDSVCLSVCVYVRAL